MIDRIETGTGQNARWHDPGKSKSFCSKNVLCEGPRMMMEWSSCWPNWELLDGFAGMFRYFSSCFLFREKQVPLRGRVGKRTNTWTHTIMETMKRIMQMVLPEPLILSDILCRFVPILEDESTNKWEISRWNSSWKLLEVLQKFSELILKQNRI